MTVLFLKLLNMSISASWLVLAVLFLRVLFRKAPKVINGILWALVGLRLVCPISPESIFSLIPSAETVPQEITEMTRPAIHSGVTILNTYVNPIISEAFKVTEAPYTHITTPMERFISVASVIWIVGVTVMSIYGVLSYLRVRRQVREGVQKIDNIWICDHVESPFILGIIKPRIFLPSTLCSEDEAYVIAHEQAHLRRRDHWWKPIGFILLTIYWFNPMLWIAYILLCRDIELACDEQVIKDMGQDSKKLYLEALIHCSTDRKMLSACPLAFGESDVEKRVKNILNYKKPAFWIMVIAVLSYAAAAVCFLTNPLEEHMVDRFSPFHHKFAAEKSVLQEKIVAIHCPVTGEKEDGLIQMGMIYGKELKAYLAEREWIACEKPSQRLYSPGSVEFVIAQDYRVTVYQRKDWRLRAYAKITYGEEEQYYRVAYEDYKTAVDLLKPVDGLIDIPDFMQDENANLNSDLVMSNDYMRSIQGMVIEEIEYVCGDSPEFFPPRMTLNFTEEHFGLSISMFSSTMPPNGSFEMSETELVLKTMPIEGITGFKQDTYVFKKDGDNFIFDASRSAKIPKFAYLGGAEAKPAIPDGAVFVPKMIHLKPAEGIYVPLIDSVIADIDHDGKMEQCTLGYGRTSGLFSFTFEIIEFGSEEAEYYAEFCPGDYYNLEFMMDMTGHFYLVGTDNNDQTSLFRVELKDKKIFIYEDTDREGGSSKNAAETKEFWGMNGYHNK